MIMDEYFKEMILLFPEEAMKIGLTDNMGYVYSKDKLNSSETALADRKLASIKRYSNLLKELTYADIDDDEKLSAGVLSWYFNLRMGGEAFLYHNYAVNHMFGPFSATVSHMADYHNIYSKTDADNYIMKLRQFPVKMTEWKDDIFYQSNNGIIPPKIIIERQIEILNDFIDADIESNPVMLLLPEKWKQQD